MVDCCAKFKTYKSNYYISKINQKRSGLEKEFKKFNAFLSILQQVTRQVKQMA